MKTVVKEKEGQFKWNISKEELIELGLDISCKDKNFNDQLFELMKKREGYRAQGHISCESFLERYAAAGCVFYIGAATPNGFGNVSPKNVGIYVENPELLDAIDEQLKQAKLKAEEEEVRQLLDIEFENELIIKTAVQEDLAKESKEANEWIELANSYFINEYKNKLVSQELALAQYVIANEIEENNNVIPMPERKVNNELAIGA